MPFPKPNVVHSSPKPFFERTTQSIVKVHNFINLFPSHTKRNVEKVMNDLGVKINQAKSAIELSDGAKDLAKGSKQGSHAHVKMSQTHHSRSQSHSRDAFRREYRCLHSPYASNRNSNIDYHNKSRRSSRESCREMCPLRRSKSRLHSRH